MELEALFSSTRWDILQHISKGPLSPMEIAEKINTTSANVSQQLRLLELGGIVKSERTSNAEPGKPRVLYSLAGDNAFLILAASRFADKKMLSLTDYHQFVMKSWFLSNVRDHVLLTQFYCLIEDHLDDVIVIGAQEKRSETVLHVVADASVKEAVKDAKVSIVFVDIEEFKKKEDGLLILFGSSDEVKK